MKSTQAKNEEHLKMV